MKWKINQSHLILQMNDRRAPILILADDCCPSFFTVPVFKSNILPIKTDYSHSSYVPTFFIFTKDTISTDKVD